MTTRLKYFDNALNHGIFVLLCSTVFAVIVTLFCSLDHPSTVRFLLISGANRFVTPVVRLKYFINTHFFIALSAICYCLHRT